MLQAFYPFLQFFLRGAVEQFSRFPVDVGIGDFQVIACLVDVATARGGERYDRLSLQIILFDEGVDDGRTGVPPDGEAHKNGSSDISSDKVIC